MPAATTIEPDFYTRGDTGALRQNDGTNDGAVNGWQGGIIYRSLAASTAVSNTTNETAFDKFPTIPANTLVAGSVLRFNYQGIATATNSTDTLAIKCYLATVTTAGSITGIALISAAAVDVANNDVFRGEGTVTIRTAGASGTLVADCKYKTTAAEGTHTTKDDFTASTTVDTTVAQYLIVTATWSVASSSNSCRLDTMVVELF